jgi:tetratricopeptide (TPR) repeat protein
LTNFREYLREIDSFTEQNILDKVIAHSLHILKTVPNSIDALRFLGQAYLEQKKFDESQSIFEKILTFSPDDFVAHVGLSSIKEENRELDAAIFHMEMAYDSQPSNVIVQEELKRLIQKRDGTRPQKINLSRGALIRMYIKGELYQQAINEIDSSLGISPDRVDLLGLRASVLYLSNSKVQAAEVCNQILLGYPYCLEANKILLQIYLENNMQEQASITRDRLTSLNPYFQFITTPGQAVEDIPDSKVELEKMDYTSAFSSDSSEYWSPPEVLISETDLERKIDEPSRESAREHTNASDTEKLLPDFMSEAGWTKSENFQNLPPEPVDYTDDEETQPFVNSDLPDWLKNFQPSDSFFENTVPQPAAEPLGIIEETDNSEERFSDVANEHRDDLSSNKEVDMPSDNPQTPVPEEESSDWMSQFFNESTKSTSNPNDGKELPDWLKSFEQNGASGEETPKQEEPDWLKSLDSEIVGGVVNKEPVEPGVNENPENNPDWIKTIDSETTKAEITEELVPPEIKETVKDENSDWLDFLKPQNNDESLDIQAGIEPESVFPVDIGVESESNVNNSSDQTDDILSSTSFPEADDFLSSLERLNFEDHPVEKIEPQGNAETQATEYQPRDDSEAVLPDWVKSVLSEPEETSPTQTDSEVEFESQDISSTDVESLETEADSAQIPEVVQPINSSLAEEPDSLSSEGAISQEASEELIAWLKEISPEAGETSVPETQEEVGELIENLGVSVAPMEQINDTEIISEDLTTINEIESEENLPQPTEITNAEVETVQENAVDQDQASNESKIEDNEIVEEVSEPKMTPDRSSMLNTLISESRYSEISPLISEMVAGGQNPDDIVDAILSFKSEKSNEFDYMQFVGDTLANFDRFDEAMEFYNQAEKLL